jgi:hypothetical protein
MPANPVEAGRKGGQSRSAKKLAACRRNGFQKVSPANSEKEIPVQEPRPGAPPLLFVARSESL